MKTLPRLELAEPTSPFDEAILVINGREEETVTIECTGARELAVRIATIVNIQAEREGRQPPTGHLTTGQKIALAQDIIKQRLAQ